ncbi:MAG: shikimate kinase [Clostridiales bacterium]
MKACALVGRQVAHSLSPQIHHLLAEYPYQLLSLEEAQAAALMRSGCYRGLNITMPYKGLAATCCDWQSETARRSGSVNTIVTGEDGRVCGYNTDYDGLKLLLQQSGIEVRGKKVLILGAGGAARTAQVVAYDGGARKVVTVSRRGAVTFADLSFQRDSQIIINATPVGMYPDSPAALIDVTEFPVCEGVVDFIYQPLKTALVLQAEAVGVPAAGGLFILVEQARRAAELFCGHALPLDLSGQIYRRLLRERINLVLIGMPGAGKTAVGQRLSAALERVFVDTDQLLEQTHGVAAGQLLSRVGETRFRELEMEQVARAGRELGQVIAVGGGAVTRGENRLFLAQNGRIYDLERQLMLLSRQGRPLSVDHGTIYRLYQQRQSAYHSWSEQIVDNNGAIEETVAAILEDFDAYFSD